MRRVKDRRPVELDGIISPGSNRQRHILSAHQPRFCFLGLSKRLKRILQVRHRVLLYRLLAPSGGKENDVSQRPSLQRDNDELDT